jgi:RNA polymerase primary sigma factor
MNSTRTFKPLGEFSNCQEAARPKNQCSCQFNSLRHRVRFRAHSQPTRRSPSPSCGASADPPQAQNLLSADEERELAERIKQGDASARKQLILANLRLVISVVRRYRSSNLSFEDLIQEGNLGLIRASQDFDPSVRDSRFATYARLWIRAYVHRALVANDSLIRVPERIFLLRKRYRQAIDALGGPDRIEESGREHPDLEQLAREIGVTVRQLKPSKLTPIERAIGGLGDEEADTPAITDSMIDSRQPEDDAARYEERLLLEAALQRLNPVEAWVLKERFGLSPLIPMEERGLRENPRAARFPNSRRTPVGLPLPIESGRSYFHRTYLELEKDCGLSIHRIHQVERIALEKLRHALGPRLLQVV